MDLNSDIDTDAPNKPARTCSSDSEEKELCFLGKHHVTFCHRTLQVLPQMCDSLDSTRLVVAFFALSSLDLLNALSTIENQKKEIIEWIYSLQVVPDATGSNATRCGFRGSTACTVTKGDVEGSEYFDEPNIAMTYAALACLLILGDDLEQVDRKSITRSLRELQLPDGSFRPVYDESESDMRFIYCATCISYILQDWSGMDIERAVRYIQESFTYEGGIAQGPGLEAHGGSTFCAVASLYLMDRVQSSFTYEQLKRLQRWCIFRQPDGFQGRPNKPTDTCYSFWVGAVLKLIDSYQFVHHDKLRNYILSAQDPIIGGIAKWNDQTPDPLHTYLGISGLSLMECDNLLPVHPALNISRRAVSFLKSLHDEWAKSR